MSDTFQGNGVKQRKWCIVAARRKKTVSYEDNDASPDESGGNASKKTQRAKSRKKLVIESLKESSVDKAFSLEDSEENLSEASTGASKKPAGKSLKKAYSSLSPKESTQKNSAKKIIRTDMDVFEGKSIESKIRDVDEASTSSNLLNIKKAAIIDDGEDISFSYGWPPLVCCFGAAQYFFIPSGRSANRLIDHEIHESRKDMFWTPTKFVRAPGGSLSSVAIAHASMGGRVAFMGKLGDDVYGETMIYHLNVNKVQTRAIKIDNSRRTAISYMKISRRGVLKATCVKPCAEDSFLSSEIKIDILKEAKMFYFNSSSLLQQRMRSTTLEAIKISKKFGGVVFFDLNIPLPLWTSSTETNMFIKEAWNMADIIEVTKQELEFLCGMEPIEKFDTKDNDKSKFVHHTPEVVKQLWHDNLKVLFVTNGTSKVHYYTKCADGFVRGMEDAPITPFTGDMSISGDAIVAGIMRMLTVQPHLITDKGYLERTVKYAIGCGVVDQWLIARILGFPPKEGVNLPPKPGKRWISISEEEYRTVEKAVA